MKVGASGASSEGLLVLGAGAGILSLLGGAVFAYLRGSPKLAVALAGGGLLGSAVTYKAAYGGGIWRAEKDPKTGAYHDVLNF